MPVWPSPSASCWWCRLTASRRDRIEVDAGLSDDKIRELALDSDRVREWMKDRALAKAVVVPGRLVNFVTKGDGV